MARPRFLVYCGLALITLWTVATLYISLQKVHNAPHMGMDARMQELTRELERVEADIKRQSVENARLLLLLKTRVQPDAALPNLAIPYPMLSDHNIAVLIFACNRPLALKNHIEQLIKYRPSKDRFPLIVSQDCHHPPTTDVAKSFGEDVTLIQHPDQSEIILPPKEKKWLGYYKISRHYKWAFNETFYTMGYKSVIVTEDDLDISIDFFEYFSATLPLLVHDKTLWCVSAWNDNGKSNLIEDKPDLLYRTDFFPGLGWMLLKETWDELSPKWPLAFWDDWLRKTDQRKDRACIRPEMSRTAMSQFGKVGVSKGQFFDKHLKLIQLNRQLVPFTKMDLSYLVRDRYDQTFVKYVYSGPSITQAELQNGLLTNGQKLPPAVRLTYEDKNTYKSTAKKYGLMDDFRAGVPRTSYRGVVPFMFGSTRVFLAPPSSWSGYDENWN